MINVNDNIFSSSPKALDQKSGVWTGSAWRAYTSTAEVISTLASPVRHIGLTVLINISGVMTEYWFRSGVADGDLVVKQTEAGGATSTLVPVTADYGPYVLTWDSALILQYGNFGHFEIYLSDGAGGWSRDTIPVTMTLSGTGDAAFSYLFNFDAVHPQALIIIK